MLRESPERPECLAGHRAEAVGNDLPHGQLALAVDVFGDVDQPHQVGSGCGDAAFHRVLVHRRAGLSGLYVILGAAAGIAYLIGCRRRQTPCPGASTCVPSDSAGHAASNPEPPLLGFTPRKDRTLDKLRKGTRPTSPHSGTRRAVHVARGSAQPSAQEQPPPDQPGRLESGCQFAAAPESSPCRCRHRDQRPNGGHTTPRMPFTDSELSRRGQNRWTGNERISKCAPFAATP